MKESYWILNYIHGRPKCKACGTIARSRTVTPYCAFCGAHMMNYKEQICHWMREDGMCEIDKPMRCPYAGNKNMCEYMDDED